MKCSECPDWEAIPNAEAEVLYGECKRKGTIVEKKLSKEFLDLGGKEETTRNKNKTRPWHECDVVSEKDDKKVTNLFSGDDEMWSSKQILDSTMYDVRKKGLPVPKAIKGLEKDDIFPTVNDMMSNDLGKLLFKYDALRGYASHLCTKYNILYKNVKSSRKILQDRTVKDIELNSEKKRLKDSMEAEAFEVNEKLRKLLKREKMLEAKVDMYKNLFEIYSNHYDTASREISRIESDRKAGVYEGGK